MSDDVVIRAFRETDRGYILKTWLHEYAETPFAQWMYPEYWRGHRDVIDRLLARSETRIAAWREDPEVIFGFAVIESPALLHFVAVRAECRQRGIATALLTDIEQDARYTHRTRHQALEHIPKGWRYDPYAALR